MLPSGNDAAMTLAEGFSEILSKRKQKPSIFTKTDKSVKTQSTALFVKEMNAMV